MNRTTERRRRGRSTWLSALVIVGLSGLGIMVASPAVAATDETGTPAAQVVVGAGPVSPLADDDPDPEDPCILDPLDPSCTPIDPVDPVDPGQSGDGAADEGAGATNNAADRTDSRTGYRTPSKSKLAETGLDVANGAWLASIVLVAGGGLLIARRLRARAHK